MDGSGLEDDVAHRLGGSGAALRALGTCWRSGHTGSKSGNHNTIQ